MYGEPTKLVFTDSWKAMNLPFLGSFGVAYVWHVPIFYLCHVPIPNGSVWLGYLVDDVIVLVARWSIWNLGVSCSMWLVLGHFFCNQTSLHPDRSQEVKYMSRDILTNLRDQYYVIPCWLSKVSLLSNDGTSCTQCWTSRLCQPLFPRLLTMLWFYHSNCCDYDYTGYFFHSVLRIALERWYSAWLHGCLKLKGRDEWLLTVGGSYLRFTMCLPLIPCITLTLEQSIS